MIQMHSTQLMLNVELNRCRPHPLLNNQDRHSGSLEKVVRYIPTYLTGGYGPVSEVIRLNLQLPFAKLITSKPTVMHTAMY